MAVKRIVKHVGRSEIVYVPILQEMLKTYDEYRKKVITGAGMEIRQMIIDEGDRLPAYNSYLQRRYVNKNGWPEKDGRELRPRGRALISSRYGAYLKADSSPGRKPYERRGWRQSYSSLLELVRSVPNYDADQVTVGHMNTRGFSAIKDGKRIRVKGTNTREIGMRMERGQPPV